MLPNCWKISRWQIQFEMFARVMAIVEAYVLIMWVLILSWPIALLLPKFKRAHVTSAVDILLNVKQSVEVMTSIFECYSTRNKYTLILYGKLPSIAGYSSFFVKKKCTASYCNLFVDRFASLWLPWGYSWMNILFLLKPVQLLMCCK